MADNKPDKESQTEEASSTKINRAIEKGNVPFSREVILAGAIAGYSVVAIFVAKVAIINIVKVLDTYWQHLEDWQLNSSEDIRQLLWTILIHISLILAPAIIVLIASGVSSSVLQNAPRFVLERIRPQISRISFSRGFSRVFSKQGFIEFLKVLVKFSGLIFLLYLAVFKNSNFFLDAFTMNQVMLPSLIQHYITKLLIYVLVALIIVATFDIVLSRFKWRQELRMTRQEVKDEHKELEGDPILKSKMRSLARSRLRRQMMQQVPSATVVITNPTHFAVALRYIADKDPAPVVVAKGQDLIALKIREIAQEHKIEIVENVDLARSLYKKVELNQAIPEEFYFAVAEIIKYVNKVKR